MARVTGKGPAPLSRGQDDVREIILSYFFQRNSKATSARGKKGYAVKITDVRRELKSSHGLTVNEVLSNLSYLINQGWIAEERVEKSVPLRSGTVIPQTTLYYRITAAGVDKVEGPGRFTNDRLSGISIEATGQSVITIGNGNRVNARFGEAASALLELRKRVVESSELAEIQKLDAIADIDTIERQFTKSAPSPVVVRGAWESLMRLETVIGLAEHVGRVAAYLAPFLS